MRPAPSSATTATRPSAPRIYNCLLGGADNSAADRDVAGVLARSHPGVADLAKASRRFILAATVKMTACGIRQFIDAGCGIPPGPMVHEVAGPAARVVYADRDPVVVSHMGARVHGHGHGITVIRGDAGDPAAVLADVQLRDIIDLSQPVCLLLGCTLSAMTAQAARRAVAGFTALLAPGSCVAVSCTSYRDPETARRIEAAYGAAGTWHSHGREDVESFLAGLAMPYGPVTDAGSWPMLRGCEGRDAVVLAGAGIKR